MKLLGDATLPCVPPQVARPGYDRRQLTHGIVHLGLGAFHRAHKALYTETVIAGGDMRWGTVGVSLRDAGVPTALEAQDLLCSVTERHGDEARTRIVGSLRAALHAPLAPQRVMRVIADPHTAIVSSTVTEKGYSQNPATSDLDLGDAGIQLDMAHPELPRTTRAVLAAGIRLRSPGAPLTVLCCDNMSNNGDTLRKLLVQYAELVDAPLARRIATDIAFPNSMVDRIVPAETPASLDAVEALLGVRDQAAIVCEPLTQWVIEDRFRR
jgi:fructuronate reductase